MIKAIFFDLDGTLLPMDQEIFIKAYLGDLVGLLAPRGYDPEAVANALWSSTRAMMKNDGSISNEERFWQSFSAILGENVRKEEGRLAYFYANEFQSIKNVCGYTPLAKQLIDRLKTTDLRLILATSPLFPRVATESRIAWAGLKPGDFEYVTTYENSRYCKPNPTYYTDLCEKLGLLPCEVVMIGNDVGDDMVAERVGMKLFLLTDCLINRSDRNIEDFRHGGFKELFEFIEEVIDENE